MPTLNAGRYLREALDSLLRQTIDDFEIIVVDDGSTDDTLSIVDSYGDERIRLLRRDEPDGLAGALDDGIKAARGKYIARQDADDISAPGRLARQVAFLESHPEVPLVGTATRMITDSGHDIDFRHVLERPTIDDLLDSNQFVHGSVMYRKKEVLDATGGYDTLFETSEDYDLWLRLAQEYPVRNLDAPLYTLRLRQESVFADDLLPAKLFGWYARQRSRGDRKIDLETRIQKDGAAAIYQALSKKEQAEIHTEIAQELLRYGRRRAAFEEAMRAWRYSPLDIESLEIAGLSLAPKRISRRIISVYRSKLNKQIIERNASPEDTDKLTEAGIP
ncbi:Glycosyl transferase family 2 [Halapricum desulfuricans]|uniref:Glycosyl transferase family 2 n=1 Tax=Halapricum desulfuricans TaxID=2841257 RepID=A0A897NRB8_9EURY|nr:Glycosyl transferase family 2 [Halapricum desulfuricans]